MAQAPAYRKSAVVPVFIGFAWQDPLYRTHEALRLVLVLCLVLLLGGCVFVERAWLVAWQLLAVGLTLWLGGCGFVERAWLDRPRLASTRSKGIL